MIITKLNGGLGNQLFQYAAGRALSDRLSTSLYPDTDDFALNFQTKRHYRLSSFKIKSAGFPASFVAKLPIFSSVKEQSFTFTHQLDKAKNFCRLTGYWQSPKYFSSIRADLLKEIVPKRTIVYPTKLSNMLKAGGTVAIHVRRGDYTKDPAAIRLLGALSIAYYRKAVKRLSLQVKINHFIVISDDLPWCRINLKSLVPAKQTTYFSQGVIDDLMLMTKASHNIIANSSYSWWGAWLNQNPEQIVIAPKNWFKPGTLSAKDLIPKTWIQV